MSASPRVALFCETFQEVNGVALTARQLVAFAQRQGRPFLAVHGGQRVAQFREGCVTRLELPRGPVSFPIESDLRYDLWLWRHAAEARKALEVFQPDVIHVTSPGEFGQLGAYLAHALKISLVASWHTNFHQFAARRLQKVLSFLPSSWSGACCTFAERLALLAVLRFYKLARVTLAPTPEQVRWLEQETGRASFLMARGVDTQKFNPAHRTVTDDTVRLGYVGRVTPEKRVRFLVEVERALVAAGYDNFSFLVVGAGSERGWLERHLKRGVFTGVLRDARLAEAYANMDVFLFPSRTDTYGNVIQEAAASGVPAIVTSEGGPRNLVVPAITGFIAADDQEFIRRTLELMADREKRRAMGAAARENMNGVSWDAAFEMTYAAYRYGQQTAPIPEKAAVKSALLPRQGSPRKVGAASS
ncbi:MAG TPA: glycosyltransferase [Candidatus Acidoferrum sp.]|nr:glycosyltransferase [Candidatus Acidoferrum sp.]